MTKRLKRFFATLLTLSMLMNTVNLTVFADSVGTSGTTGGLKDIISRSAEVLGDGSCEIAVTIDGENGDLTILTDSNADEKECDCEITASGSNCIASDSNCKDNGCTCESDDDESSSIELDRYSDVQIIDYTSKWVELNQQSIKIWDVNNDVVIYEYDAAAGSYKWADGMKPDGASVKYEEVNDSDNTSGSVYRIVWKMKDGTLKESDAYKMTYSVQVDTAEDGFEYGVEYPVHTETLVTYEDENGEKVESVFTMTQAPVIKVETKIEYETLGNLASKKSELVNRRENRYEINLRVPGADAPDVHDEVIVMVDGSYSGDDEWPNTRKAIIEIGEAVLDGGGNTQLTLMTFGMADNIVLEQIKSVEELDAELTDEPGTLLYGRSSTNCEAGFTGIQEYIEEKEEDLNQVHVIYITDGEINTDETPYNFYQWKNNAWLKRDIKTLLNWSLGEELAYITYESTVVSDATAKVFGQDANYTNVDLNSITEEQYIEWADLVWEAVYDHAGLTPGTEYPVSEVETAFVSYDKANNTHIQEIWYYTLWGRSYPNRWTRTPKAATALAAMDEVAHLYMVDTNGATSWMNPKNGEDSSKNIVGDNVSFTYNAYVNGLTSSLKDVLDEIAMTPYNDVVVTDYMSKWVNLDQTSVKIVDESTGEAIYSSAEGWLIEAAKRPTSEEVPVEIELVPEDEYDEDDNAVDGNTSGEIYKLTWHVKDGGLLRSDQYCLKYEVTVDTEENGFVYGKDYPANGNTTVTYTDVNNDPKEEEVEVPNVDTSVGNDPTEGTKVDKLLDRDSNLYEVKVSVPGADTEVYDEIILMIDASSSQFKNIDDLKQTLIEIGENVLNENGTMHLTLMHFGIGAATPYSGDMYSIFTANSQEDLAKKLETVDYSVIERWPTGTNCEGSFNHLQDYIENSPNLENAYIIYTSDGETNMSDELRLWSDWKNHQEWHYSGMTTAKIISQTMNDECNNINAGVGVSEPTKQIFGDIVAAYGSDLTGMTAALKEAVKDETKANAWVDLAWQMAYEANGLTLSESYPVSTIEGAFIKTFGMEGTWHYHFAYASLASSYEGHHGSYRAYEKGHRAAAACNELAEMEQVEEIYLLGMNGNGGNSCLTSWMNATEENKANETAKVFADHEKITFIDCTEDNKPETLMAELEYLGEQISLTPMNNVAVVDYMSKWVNLDLNSIKILDGDKVIYAYNESAGQYEWLIEEAERPTSKTPIIVELVDPADYADGGADVVGNTSGAIYRITWNIKDGALRLSDNYHMTYRVTVDAAESGFVYGTDYPANGNTTVEYTDENGTRNYDPIDVPDVDVPAEEPEETEPTQPTEPEETEPTQPTELEGTEPTQPSEPESTEPTQPSEPEVPEPDEEPEEDRGRVLSARDENEPETEGFTGAVLGAFDTVEILDDMIPLGVLPATGDMSVIWIALSILSMLGLAGTSLIERKKRK